MNITLLHYKFKVLFFHNVSSFKKFFDIIWIFSAKIKIVIVIFWRKSEIFANPDSIDVFMRFFHKNSRFKNWWLFFVKMIELRSKNEINKQSWSSFILSFPRIFIQSNLCNEIQNFLLSTRFFISYKFVCFFIGILGSVE